MELCDCPGSPGYFRVGVCEVMTRWVIGIGKRIILEDCGTRLFGMKQVLAFKKECAEIAVVIVLRGNVCMANSQQSSVCCREGFVTMM